MTFRLWLTATTFPYSFLDQQQVVCPVNCKNVKINVKIQRYFKAKHITAACSWAISASIFKKKNMLVVMFLSQNPEWSFSPSSERKLFQQKLYSYSLVFSSLRSRCCSTTCSILPFPMLSWSETHSTSPPMFNPRPPPTGLHLQTKEWERVRDSIQTLVPSSQ